MIFILQQTHKFMRSRNKVIGLLQNRALHYFFILNKLLFMGEVEFVIKNFGDSIS